MTVSTTTAEASFAGNDVATSFSLGFEIEDEDHLVVEIIRTNGEKSPQTLNVGYTVSGVGDEAGATINMTLAPETGETVTVRRVTPKTQPVEILPQSNFDPAAVLSALDRMTLVLQEATALSARALTAIVGETIDELPSVTARASKVLGFDGTGKPIAVTGLADTLVSSLWETILQQSTITGARQELYALGYLRNATLVDANSLGGGSGASSSAVHATSVVTTNLPSGETGANGHLLHLSYNADTNYGQQLYLSPSGKLYSRGYSSSVWSAWKAVLLEGQSAFEFIASQDASNSATLDFTGFDATKYDSYVFEIGNLIPATNDVSLTVRLSTNAGSSYNSGASDYQWHVAYLRAGTLAGLGPTAGSSLLLTPNVASNGVSNTGSGVSGTARIMLPNIAQRTTVSFAGLLANTAGGLTAVPQSGGVLDAAAAVNAARFLFSGGNITSGTITMYGLRNS